MNIQSGSSSNYRIFNLIAVVEINKTIDVDGKMNVCHIMMI
jgi:hypothetical protein